MSADPGGADDQVLSKPGAGAAVVFGTRPEIIKLAGIVELLGARATTIYSGQHFDHLLSEVFFGELNLSQPDVRLAVGGRSRAQQIGQVVLGLEGQFDAHRPSAVIVQGDTNSALGGALAANAVGVPLVHVEAGLRSFDRAMPEEHNRVVIDHLADLCLAPTEQARDHLLAERIPPERVAVTGNTVVDAASRLLPGPAERAGLVSDLGLERGAYVLATFHRPENVDDAGQLASLLEHLARLGLPVLFPAHPRTRKRVDAFELGGPAAGVRMVAPIGYRAFLGLAAECAFLVSDSGGVQEEASVVKRPALVVRRSTERPEVQGTFATLVPSLADLPDAAAGLLAGLAGTHRWLAGLPTPYGDGRASARCVHHIARMLEDRA